MQATDKIDADGKVKNQIALGWKILYNEDFEEIPDPNKPENTAYMNAMKKQRQDAIKRFVEGAGKDLLKEWKRQIRGTNLFLLFGTDINECTCQACLTIRDIRSKLNLIQEMQQALEE